MFKRQDSCVSVTNERTPQTQAERGIEREGRQQARWYEHYMRVKHLCKLQNISLDFFFCGDNTVFHSKDCKALSRFK